MAANYLFQLSPLELNWLAGAFGITRLPLTDNPLRHIPNSQLAEEAKAGLASLQSRGLIRQASEGYQVDRLPAAIVKWLGSASAFLNLQVHMRNGISRHAQVLTEQDASMAVSLEEGSYQFLFLPTSRAVSDYVLKQVAASFADPKTAAAKYALSQPVTVLRAAWKDLSLAAKMLKVVGVKSEVARPLLDWAASLEWIVALEHVQIPGKNRAGGGRAVLCGTRQKSWLAQMVGQPDETAVFCLVNSQTAHASLQNLL